MKLIASLLLGVLLCSPFVFACTTLIAGKDATVDGSTMATHSDDGEGGGDARVMVVPAEDHAPGSVRNVYYDTEDYPRYVGKDRGPGYYPKEGQKSSVPIGSIPQVNHTYARFEATYGIINEHQLGIGESTCSGVFGASAIGYGGKALFSVDELTRLALERCKTARCAVQLMGDFAVKYGFYGAGSFEGTAESLMVIDPEEAFIFHILPDDSGTSAIWVAQRVADDAVGVVANMFTIRAVDLTDSKNFLGSASVHEVAQRKGWWKPSDGLLDFTAVYSDGEYAHKFYSGRRMWGAYRLLAPSAKLPTDYTNLRYDRVYPAFMKPDQKVSPADFMRVHRDHYDGTEFDLHKGLAAGYDGNPNRWATKSPVKGNWERPIGLFRTTHTHLVQARSWLPNEVGGLMWYGPHAAGGTVFVPFACGQKTIPSDFSVGDPAWIDRSSAYWAFRWVFNIGQIRHDLMWAVINKAQLELEANSSKLVASLSSPHANMVQITDDLNRNAEAILKQWWALPDTLISRFADGWIDDANPAGYPDWWLKAVGYPDGPPPPPKNNASLLVKGVAMEKGTALSSCASTVKECVVACPDDGYKACVHNCLQAC